MNHICIVASVKLALITRDAWIESQCASWLAANWHSLNESAKTEIRRSIERGFESDYERANAVWRDVRSIWVGD